MATQQQHLYLRPQLPFFLSSAAQRYHNSIVITGWIIVDRVMLLLLLDLADQRCLTKPHAAIQRRVRLRAFLFPFVDDVRPRSTFWLTLLWFVLGGATSEGRRACCDALLSCLDEPGRLRNGLLVGDQEERVGVGQLRRWRAYGLDKGPTAAAVLLLSRATAVTYASHRQGLNALTNLQQAR